jgi:guanylate kinase
VRDCALSEPLYYQDNTLAGILFIISAPSGSGKSTLVNRLRSQVTDLDFSVSYTTRARRPSEQQDRDYHYIARAEVREMVDRGEFLEWAEVFGNYYGTACRSLTDAQAAGKDLLLDIDVQGAAQVREKMPDAVSIFLLAPDPETLAQRLRERSRKEGSLLEEEIARRLAKARSEIENYRQYRYILVNDILDDAVKALTAIVITERAARLGAPPDPETARMLQLADKCRQTNATDRVYKVLSSFGLVDMHATRA